MNTNTRNIANRILLLLAAFLVACLPLAAAPTAWPQFRGPNCSGVADAKPPIHIGPTNGVRWSAEVPWSPSSPCVWKDRIFLTTYDAGELQTRSYDARTGKLLWSKGVKPDHLETFHKTEGSPAAATPATDGQCVVSYFGSFGVICYDFAGRELWRHPLTIALSGGGFGSGTSPIILHNRVLLNRDQDENSSLLALDLATGKTAWETARPDAGGSFGTPIFWRNSGAEEVVMPGSLRLKGYDLKTGSERWEFGNVAGFCCTTPVIGDGLLFFAAWSPGQSDSPWPTWEKFLEKMDKNHDGVVSLDEVDPEDRDFLRGIDKDHDGKITTNDWRILMEQIAKSENVMVAVKPGGRGNISATHLAWKATKGLPYVPSPLYYEGRVYLVRDGGMMSCFDAKTGKIFYDRERLTGAEQPYYASPVAADGHIFVVSVPGKLTVVKAGGDKPEILRQANFGERIFATPALVGTHLYLRTKSKLYAF
jgi:outer membrane protein assembly factor BamB